MRICLNGEWQKIMIDDFVPCHNDLPVFTNSIGKELWVLLLEKAWAKIHGSYLKIEGGYADEVLHELTGAPSEYMETREEQLWDVLMKAHNNHAIMAATSASTGNQEAAEALKEVGMTAARSYGIRSLHEIVDITGERRKLVNANGV